MKDENMNEVMTFSNNGVEKVREIIIDGKRWIIEMDVAESLGYGCNNRNSKASEKAIREHVDTEDKGVSEMDTPGGKQRMAIINESGMYALIFGSKLDSAKRFKRWVTHDVLPSIRKTGSYSINKSEIDVNNHLLEIVNLQQKQIEDLTNRLNSFDAPRESVQASQVAYMLQSKGIDIGRNNFIKFLRDNGYMIRNANRVNVATKRSLDEGLMELKEKEVHVRGNNFMNIQTFITSKGQDYFLRMFGA